MTNQLTSSHLLSLLAGTEFQASLLSGLVLAVILAGFKIFRARPRIVWSTNHQFAFYLPPVNGAPPGTPGLQVITTTIHVANEGSAPAKSVEVHFTGKPGHFQIWPSLERQEVQLADGAFIVRIPLLAASESFALELLQTVDPTPTVIRVRSEAGEAHRIAMTPTRVLSWQLQAFLICLICIGAWTAIRTLVGLLLAQVQ